MKRTARRSDCPINFALQVVGDGWSLLVIRDLMFTDRATYTDFLQAEEGIATNVLAARLKHLQAQGLIRKRGTGRGAAYGLTKKGLDLLPAMLELISWSAAYDSHTAAPPAFVARIRADQQAMARELRDGLKRRHSL
ncbi:MAG TPA: helix-turn-helix domain-containing protein [Gemmatimonadales bacterium]|nr:helix-turn-helix domain-containing protein [Gemmatimonadales bacterium]